MNLMTYLDTMEAAINRGNSLRSKRKPEVDLDRIRYYAKAMTHTYERKLKKQMQNALDTIQEQHEEIAELSFDVMVANRASRTLRSKLHATTCALERAEEDAHLLEAERMNEMDMLRAHFAKEAEVAVADHAKEVDFIRSQFAEEVERMTRDHLKELDAVRAHFAEEANRVEADHIKELDAIRSRYAGDMERRMRDHADDMLRSEAAFHMEMERMTMMSVKEKQEMEASHAEDMKQLILSNQKEKQEMEDDATTWPIPATEVGDWARRVLPKGPKTLPVVASSITLSLHVHEGEERLELHHSSGRSSSMVLT